MDHSHTEDQWVNWLVHGQFVWVWQLFVAGIPAVVLLHMWGCGAGCLVLLPKLPSSAPLSNASAGVFDQEDFEEYFCLFIVILDLVTMVPKALKISSHPTSATAFVLQWTCA